MTGAFITVPEPAGREIPAYLSLPEKPNGRAVVLGMSIWGVNADLRSWADYLAALGYAVMAPNLFWRSDPSHAIDYDFSFFDRVLSLSKAEDDARGLMDLEVCGVELQRITGAVSLGLVGWCYGGRLACLAAAGTRFAAAVAFYPTHLETRLDVVARLRAPISVHLPEFEEFGTTEDSIERIVTTLREEPAVEHFVYSGVKHGFGLSPPHPNFNAAAARIADTRAALFLARVLGDGSADHIKPGQGGGFLSLSA